MSSPLSSLGFPKLTDLQKCWSLSTKEVVPACCCLCIPTQSLIYKYMVNGSPIESVDQCEASSPPCWRVQPLSYRRLGKKEWGFIWNNIVMLCGLGLQSLSHWGCPLERQKGFTFYRKYSVVIIWWVCMMPVISECLLEPELNSESCARVCTYFGL